MDSRIRALRDAAGLTQADLAGRAGVSRQLIGAVETGRHLPRVDAALAIAAALGVEVTELFRDEFAPVDVLTGAPAVDGALVRATRVGDRIVTAPVRVGRDGWDVADGTIEDGSLVAHTPIAPGLAVMGCEPGLELLERMLREAGSGALSVAGSSEAALRALDAGRVHAAVVHGPAGSLAARVPSVEVRRLTLASWRVGLAAPPDARAGWWRDALTGASAVIQREPGAGVQQTFEVARGGVDVPGPRADGHLDAARRSIISGLPAVTIEPAALAVGAIFHPLDVHAAQLWVATEWMGLPVVTEAIDVVSGKRFQRRLTAVGGYDLAGCGTLVA
jgi:DNA-binding XRE family transcriptional regulator